jgi:hypothetical protein
VLTFADGDTIGGAEVSLAATGPSSRRLTAATAETGDGIYIGELSFTNDGVWRIEVNISSEEGNGSVAFDEVVPAPVGSGVPIVKVDTINPDWIGVPVGSDSAILGGGSGDPSSAPDVDYDLRVEALVEADIVPLSIIYGVQIVNTDASVVDSVTVEAISNKGAIGPVVLEGIGSQGVFRGPVDFPDAAKWEVAVNVIIDGTTNTFAFGENLPWPHYSIEAGKPKVKLDTINRALEGSLVTIETSPIFSHEL